MLDAIKPLLESGIINQDTVQAINEAWESKLSETREQVRIELREEFAQKYEHDKNVMVEALDKMVTESLHSEIVEFKEERDAMNVDRVKAQEKLKESAKKFNDFMVTKLAEEIKELRGDRKLQLESKTKLEQFVINSLAREIREFEQDKRAVVETKVKLVSEARDELNKLKQKFISESAKKLNESVAKHLKGEIKQLKEDIESAKENSFGRRIFEAFAAEFSVTHLNEKSETRELIKQLDSMTNKIQESASEVNELKRLVESKEREVRLIKESNLREKTMSELLSTLNEEKSEVMRNLLESVQTPKLKAAFEKYLPAVINKFEDKKSASKKKELISESVVTGDKSAKNMDDSSEERDNVIAIKRLAGL